MAFDNFSDTFNGLRQFPLGRFTFAMRGVVRAAEAVEAERGDGSTAAIKAMAEDHLAFGRTAHKVRIRYASAQVGDSEHKRRAPEIDAASDRTLSAIFRQVGDYLTNFGRSHEKGRAAHEFNRIIFPTGARAVTSLPQVEQVERMETILKLCDTELAGHIQILKLEDWIDRLRTLTNEYRDELERVEAATVSYGEVRAAEQECQERLGQLVVRVGGDFNERTPEHAALRAALLAAVHEQNVALAAANRRTRRPVDIHPDTGVEEDVILFEEPMPEPELEPVTP